MKFPQVVRDLLAARDVLVRRGWVQGDLGSANGPCCAMGAAASAVEPRGNPYLDERIDRELPQRRFLAAVIDTDYITEWNDTPGRTIDEVLAAFDEAASLALSEACR